MRTRLLALLLLLPLLASALTLDEAVARAKEHNRELQKAREDVASTEADYRNIRGSLLPQITLSGQYQLTKTWLPDSAVPDMTALSDIIYTEDDLLTPYGVNDTTFINNDETAAGYIDNVLSGMIPAEEQEEGSIAAQVELNQVVFMGGKLINGLRVAAKARTIAQKNYTVIEQNVVFETKDMFYAALLSQQVVDIQREALETAEQHFDNVNKMFAQGVVSEYDHLRAELEVAKLRPEVVEAENNYHLVIESLRDQIGWEEGELVLEGEFVLPQIEDVSLDNAIAEGLSNRTELDLASINVDIQDVLYTTERGNFLPNIAITGSYAKYTAADEFAIEADDFGDRWSIGIGFSMPLFTGLSNTAKTAKTRHQLNIAKLDLRDLEEKLELDVRNSWLQLQHDLENVRAQQNNVALAQKGMTIAEARYENSVGIQLEVIDAQMMVKSTRLQYLESVYRVIMSWEALQKALGRTI